MTRGLVVSFLLGAPSVVACGSTPPTITLPPQQEFPDASTVTLTSATDWKGEPIVIQNDSVDFVVGATGVRVVVSTAATKMTAFATFTARADDAAHLKDAQESIADAKTSFAMNGFTVTCPHGQTHGTSRSASAGCKLLTVTIPAGTAAQPLDLHVVDVNGGIVLSAAAIASKLTIEENGTGLVDVKVDPQKGAAVTVKAGFDVAVGLPSTFATDAITLEGGQQARDVDTTAFPDLVSGKAFGAAGTGAASVLVRTSTLGTIKLVKL